MREGRNRPTRTGNPARAVQHRRVQPLRHAARIARVSGGTGRGYRKQHRRWTRSDFCRRDEPAGGEERAERAVGGVSADDLPARWRADCEGVADVQAADAEQPAETEGPAQDALARGPGETSKRL